MPNKDGDKEKVDVKVNLPEVKVTDKKSVPKTDSNNAKRAAQRDKYNELMEIGTDKALRKAKAMEIENKYGFFTAKREVKKKG